MSEELTAEDILDAVSDEHADDVDTDDVEAEIESFTQFGVTGSELRNGVLSKVAANLGVTVDELTGNDGSGDGDSSGPADLVDIGSIDEAEEWVTIEAEVVQLWDNDSDAIAQVGLLDDGTGRIKFTSWAKSELMMLEEGEQYRFENVVTDEYNERMSVKLNSSTNIEFLDEEMDISNDTEVEGNFVSMQAGSGLIKRCSEGDCTRPLGNNDRCAEHGEVEGEHDLRIKGVLDDGHETHSIICNREFTEDLTGVTLEEAKEKAREALDMEVVADEMAPELLGRYFVVTGARLGDRILVNEMEETTEMPDVEELLVRARSM